MMTRWLCFGTCAKLNSSWQVGEFYRSVHAAAA